MGPYGESVTDNFLAPSLGNFRDPGSDIFSALKIDFRPSIPRREPSKTKSPTLIRADFLFL